MSRAEAGQGSAVDGGAARAREEGGGQGRGEGRGGRAF